MLRRATCLWLYKRVYTNTLHTQFTHKAVSREDRSKLSCGHRRWGRWRGRPAWGTASQRACLCECVCRRECACSNRMLCFHLRVVGTVCVRKIEQSSRVLVWEDWVFPLRVCLRAHVYGCVNALMCGRRGECTGRGKETSLSNKISTVAA